MTDEYPTLPGSASTTGLAERPAPAEPAEPRGRHARPAGTVPGTTAASAAPAAPSEPVTTAEPAAAIEPHPPVLRRPVARRSGSAGPDPATEGGATERLPDLLPAGGRAARPRDPFFDNVKFLAIVLVVVGHFWEPLRNHRTVLAAYETVYLFHMPVFILVSGYLSRTYTGSPAQVRRLVTTVLVPYVIFHVSYQGFLALMGQGSFELNLLQPSFAMWFLVALFLWRITTPLWLALRPGIAVGVAVAVSLLSGAAAIPDVLDLSRTFGFLPFFVAGLVMPARYFDLVRTRVARIVAIPVLLGTFAAALLFFGHSRREWLFYRSTYEALGVSTLSGIGHRALILAAGFVLLSAFLAVVPRSRTWFTALGAGTLYVYLLHRYPRKALEFLGGYDHPAVHTIAGIVILTVAAAGLAVLLATPWVMKVFRPIVEPRLTFLFRRLPATGPGR